MALVNKMIDDSADLTLVQSKRCGGCDKRKSRAEFKVSSRSRDGLSSRCHRCEERRNSARAVAMRKIRAAQKARVPLRDLVAERRDVSTLSMVPPSPAWAEWSGGRT